MKGFHRNSSQIHPAQFFHRNIKIISLESKCTLEKNENWFWEYLKATHFLWAPSSVSSPLQTAVHHLQQQLFPWDGLKSALSFGSWYWWAVAKQTKCLFSGLIKRSVYNPGSVTKLPFLKIKSSLESYMQCHDLNTVSDDLHCVSKKQ